MSVKKILPTLVLALIAGATGMFFSKDITKKIAEPTFTNATLYPANFRSLPEFTLNDHNGTPFTKANVQDTWTVLFFGFANCPDVCPNTLAVLSEAYKQLGDLQSHVQVVFLSVDPERDNLTLLKDYTTYFHPDFIGVTAELPELRALTQNMSIHFEKRVNDANPDDYQVDHYAGLFVIDPTGKQHALISPPFAPGVIAQDISTMINFY